MLAVSEADPYVTLQLPTAPGTKFKTKTITNSSHPVWNETFSFLIQSRVKVKARVTLLRTGYILLLEHISLQGSVGDTGEVSLFPAWIRLCGRECVTQQLAVSLTSGKLLVLSKAMCGRETGRIPS